MGFSMARRTKRLWTDAEKRSICFQAAAPHVSVAQVAYRYAVNANLIFKWLRDPRFAPEPDTAPTSEPRFLPVEVVDHDRSEGSTAARDAQPNDSCIETDVAGGHRLRIVDTYDPEALARLIRSLSP